MLRITQDEGDVFGLTLKLEGNVTGEWAQLLERESSALLRSRGSARLDLIGIAFVDRAGLETLKRLSRAGVEIRCRPGPVASVLEGEGVRIVWDADGWNDDNSPEKS